MGVHLFLIPTAGRAAADPFLPGADWRPCEPWRSVVRVGPTHWVAATDRGVTHWANLRQAVPGVLHLGPADTGASVLAGLGLVVCRPTVPADVGGESTEARDGRATSADAPAAMLDAPTPDSQPAAADAGPPASPPPQPELPPAVEETESASPIPPTPPEPPPPPPPPVTPPKAPAAGGAAWAALLKKK